MELSSDESKLKPVISGSVISLYTVRVFLSALFEALSLAEKSNVKCPSLPSGVLTL